MTDQLKTKSRLRIFGLICIGIAVVMVGAGVTVLDSLLAAHRLAFVVYWLVCFAMTMLAGLVALLDVARMRWEGRAAQRALLEETLRDVEREKQARKKSGQ